MFGKKLGGKKLLKVMLEEKKAHWTPVLLYVCGDNVTCESRVSVLTWLVGFVRAQAKHKIQIKTKTQEKCSMEWTVPYMLLLAASVCDCDG